MKQGPKTAENQASKGSVGRSAAAMSLGTLSSRILGLVRDVVITAFFSRTITDVFYVAFRLPNMFRRLLGEGSLAVSFIPVYVERREHSQEEAAQLSGTMWTLVLAVAAGVSALGVVLMEPLIELVVSGKGYSSVPGKMELTVNLGRIMFSYLFLVTAYAYLSAILQAHKRFFVPAVAPALFNAVFILFACLPDGWVALPGGFLAWGVLIGGVVQSVLVAGLLWRLGFFPRLRWNPKAKGFLVVLRNMVPGMLGLGVLQIMGFLNVYFASRLDEGSHTYVYLGDRILELPQSLIAISIGTAILPTLSEFRAKNQMSEFLQTAHRYMRLLLFLALPAAVGMWVLAEPIVRVLFMRGSFGLEDLQATAQVVQVYAFLLVASSLNKVTVPSFYAIKNTWLPACTSATAVLVHVLLAPQLMEKWGLSGLVASTAIAGFVNVALVLSFYRVFIGSARFLKLLGALLHFLPATLGMGALAYYLHWLVHMVFAHFRFSGALPAAIALFFTIGVAIFAYFGLSHLFRVPETQPVLQRFRRRR